jgi:hypothetical protein
MFVRLIRMVGLRDTDVILVQAPRGDYVQFREVFYMPMGHVVWGYMLRLRGESPRSLSVVESS